MEGGMDSKTHAISLSLHDFHLNSVGNAPSRGNVVLATRSSMGGPRLSSNSESRIDSLEGVTHSDLRAIYSPQIQMPSSSSQVPSLRPSSIARVQSMPPHQSQHLYSSPIPISSHRDPPPYDKATAALQRAHFSVAETEDTQASYPLPSVLSSSSSSSAPSSQPITALTIEELRRFPLMENIFREFNDPFTAVTRLTRYEPHEALLAVPHNDLPRPSPQLSADLSESLYAMPPPPPYPISSSLVK